MIPQKPFESYKWRWLSVAPTESLLSPPVFLGVLRALSRHESEAPSSHELISELAHVRADTHSPVDLARTGNRNLIRNSGQYWKGTGLLRPVRGEIQLTDLGRRVAVGEITQSEFAALMIHQTVLPNPWTYSAREIRRWRDADLEIRPLQLILEVIEKLGEVGSIADAYLTNDELVTVVVPLAGGESTIESIGQHIIDKRTGRLDLSGWPDCAPMANDMRLAREFLLFLSNFGVLQLVPEGPQDEQKFRLSELSTILSSRVVSEYTIFSDDASAASAVNEIKHSDLPSIIVRQRTLAIVSRRTGQGRFRSMVLDMHGSRCLLTGEQIPEVLEAAHIVPTEHNGSDDQDNSLCLRADIHRLFDSGNIRIRQDGDVLLSETVRASVNYAILPRNVQVPAFVKLANLHWRDSYL